MVKMSAVATRRDGTCRSFKTSVTVSKSAVVVLPDSLAGARAALAQRPEDDRRRPRFLKRRKTGVKGEAATIEGREIIARD